MMRLTDIPWFGLPLLLFSGCTNGATRMHEQNRTINVLVVDEARIPVADADVWLETFVRGKGMSMGHFKKEEVRKTDHDGRASFSIKDNDPLQIGAAPCGEFLAQGMTVVPRESGKTVNLEVVVAPQYCK